MTVLNSIPYIHTRVHLKRRQREAFGETLVCVFKSICIMPTAKMNGGAGNLTERFQKM